MTTKHMKLSVMSAALLMISAATNSYAATSTDTDHDGIPDISESLIHTDPLNADTDGDGINVTVHRDCVDNNNSCGIG